MSIWVDCRCCGWRKTRFMGLCSTCDLKLRDLKDKVVEVMLAEVIWEPYYGELPRVEVGDEPRGLRRRDCRASDEAE